MTDPFRFVCPECGTHVFRSRQQQSPRYICRKGHEFDAMFDKKTARRVSSRRAAG